MHGYYWDYIRPDHRCLHRQRSRTAVASHRSWAALFTSRQQANPRPDSGQFARCWRGPAQWRHLFGRGGAPHVLHDPQGPLVLRRRTIKVASSVQLVAAPPLRQLRAECIAMNPKRAHSSMKRHTRIAMHNPRWVQFQAKNGHESEDTNSSLLYCPCKIKMRDNFG